MSVKIDRSTNKINRSQSSIQRGQRGINRLPRVESIFDDDTDPLANVEYDVDSLEQSANAEMSEIVKQIKEQKKARLEQFRQAQDPDFYVVVCFQSSDQKKEFLQKSNLEAFEGIFANGLELARKLNLDIKTIEIAPLPLRGKPHKFSRKEVI